MINKRILFFSEAVTLAHIARCITLAERLYETDCYTIGLAADSRYEKIIGKLPYQCIPLYSIPSELFFKKLSKGSVLYDVNTISRYVDEDLKIIEAFKPDFIIGDFRLSLAISSRLSNIPYATISNAYWSPYADIKYTIPDIALTKLFGVTIAQKLFNWVKPVIFIIHSLAFNKTCKKFGLPPLKNDMREIYTHADYTFYADIEAITTMKAMPDNHVFIGPLLWSAQVELPGWWVTLPDDNPIVFVTLGSSGDASLVASLLEVLSTMPVTVICVTANNTNLDKEYANIYTADFLPAEDVVKKSDIVICNGGSPMVYQSLVENKVVIGIPGNLDQYLMMSFLHQSGRGFMIRSGQISSKTIKKVMNQAIEAIGNQSKVPLEGIDIQIERIEKIIAAATK